MSERRGVLSAGTWCVDFNKSIARWPDEDTSNEVLAIDRQNGGIWRRTWRSTSSASIPNFPVEAMGVVGDDDLGRFLFAECDARGVNRTALHARPGGATMSVDAFNVESQRAAHPFLSSGRGGRDDARRLRFLFDPGENSASWIARRTQGDGRPMARRGQRLGRGVAQGARLRPQRESRTHDNPSRPARRARPAMPAASRLAHRQRLRDRRAGGTRDTAARRLDRPGRGRTRNRGRARASAPCAGRRLTFPRARSWADATDRALPWARSPCRRARS